MSHKNTFSLVNIFLSSVKTRSTTTAMTLGLLLTLSGCQTGKINSQLPENINLSQIQHWELKARVSIKTPDDALAATLTWQKNSDNFDFHLYGAFGITYAHLIQQDHQATLHLPEDQTYYHQDAQHLLLQALGWEFPIDALTYWVKGLPSDQVGEEVTKNAQGELSSVTLNGWQVDFMQYETYSGFSMPRMIKAKHPQMSLKLIVKNWEFLPYDY